MYQASRTASGSNRAVRVRWVRMLSFVTYIGNEKVLASRTDGEELLLPGSFCSSLR